jgi:hypothetical protein
MALLEGTIDEINTKGAAVLDTNLNAHIDDLFGALYKDPGADETAIARLEYAYLPLLRHSRRTLGLHRLLAKDPAFFTDVLCHGFKATGATQEEQLTEQQAMQARHAWELLHSWDDPIPGTKNDGSIDETALQSWVEKAIDLVTTKDRKIVGKHYIGKILAHALPDTDGEWPHRAIRNIIEQQKDKDIEHGFENECFNKRGAHARDPKGGGRPERTLETQYRNWATAINKEYPRTAAVLNRIADNWQQNAIEQDQRSKKWELEE